MSKEWTGAELLKLSGSYWPCCALQAAVMLDVFTALDTAAGRMREDELALRLSCEGRSLGMLLTALVAMDLLDRDGTTLILPDGARRYLSRNSPEYVGFIIMHHADIMPAWTRLAEAVRGGTKTRERPSTKTGNPEERKNFLMGMFNIAVAQAENVAATLDLSGRKRLLDLGGGPGTYAVYFCRANPQLSATIYDLPSSAPFARETVERFNLADRIDFAGGDFLKDALPTGYDAVWLSQVLHGETPENAAALMRRGAQTLNPGGLLCVQEFIINDDRKGPVHPALFSLNMLVGTDGGQSYTQGEITAMMRQAGAAEIRRIDSGLPMGSGVLVGSVGNAP